MEPNGSCRNHHISPLPLSTRLSNTNLKVEILDGDFCTGNLSSSKGFLPDCSNLDQFPLAASSFNFGNGIQPNFFDTIGSLCHGSSADFGSFGHGSSTNFGLLESNEEDGSRSAAIQDFQGGGLSIFSDREDSLMEIETALEYHDSNPLCFVLPDETSCVTADNPGCFKENGSNRGKNCIQSKESEPVTTKCGKGRKKSKSAKGQWTAEEDRLLIHLVERYGVRKWSNIAQMLKRRIGKQCRERWHNHLRPDIKKDVWTEEEDRILIEVHAQVGNKWAEIAKSLPGRTENTIKNHWNATKRRQFTKRKCRTKWPKPSSLLQNYIKSLNFEKEAISQSKDIQPPSDSGIVGNSTISAQNNIEIEFNPDEYGAPEYELDDEFMFDDEHLFEGSNMDLFMDDIPIGPSPEFDEELCFDAELPFDMPQLMQGDVKKEFDGNA